MGEAPIAFVSHATEDKERFVRPFAQALRAKGIDAWVDEWEIFAGDSLVQKIFEEGIRKATAIIVVLSKTSVAKKWVREELDAAIVARINNATRLIPVVIEACEVPVALQATKWIRADSGRIENAADEVVRAILMQSEKPPVGSPPAYTRSSIVSISGLEQVDTAVLLAMGKTFLENGPDSMFSKSDFLSEVAELGLSDEQIDESLEILERQGYIKGTHGLGGSFIGIQMRNRGARELLERNIPNFRSVCERIVVDIVNHQGEWSSTIAERLGIQQAVVDFVIDDLGSRGLVRFARAMAGRNVYDVSAQLRRSVR